MVGGRKMRLNSLCIECQLTRHFKKAAQIANEADRLDYLLAVTGIISRSTGEPAPLLSAQCRELEDKYLGVTERYAEIKHRYNALMLEREKEIAQRIEASTDPLHLAMLYSRAGNYIDFGTEQPFSDEMFSDILERTEKEQLDPTTYARFLADMDKAEKLLFITDNCGEIVMDKLLLIQIAKRWSQVKITVMVRGEPILNDATMEDAEQVGLTELFNVVDNGTSAPGTWLPSLPADRLELVNSADVIISKGQANTECLCGCGLNIYYLLLCKCTHFANIFSVERYTGMFINESEAGKLV